MSTAEFMKYHEIMIKNDGKVKIWNEVAIICFKLNILAFTSEDRGNA
jgi:hypothetical protein